MNQVIITWLIYRRPKNLMKSLTSVIDRVMMILPGEPAAPGRGKGGRAAKLPI